MKILCVAALALGACSAASAGTWNFEFSGLVGQESYYRYAGEVFSVTSSFTGSDLNADGLITAPEVTRFLLQGHSVVPSGTFGTPDGILVQQGHLDRLEFSPASNVLIDASAGFVDSWHGNFVGLSWNSGGGRYVEGADSEWIYPLDAGVHLTVSAVPEPAAVPMLLLGLAFLGAIRLRRGELARRPAAS